MKDTETKPITPTPENVVLPVKKKRVKPRFTTREQIIQRIDKFTVKAQRKRAEQSKCYAQANHIRRDDRRLEELAGAAKHDVLGDKLGKQADRLEKDVLPKLKAKLAEFDTQIIPGIDIDKSIPAI